MTDVFDTATRSRVMSRIRGKNTSPEMFIRKGLFKKGFRFRLHSKQIQGKPDIVLKKYGAIIFVHGCFWHGHGCRYFKWPKTNTSFWEAKIKTNIKNDAINREALLSSGWRVCIVWECRVRAMKKTDGSLISEIADWITGENSFVELGT